MLETIGIILVAVALVAVGVFSWRWENAGEDDEINQDNTVQQMGQEYKN